MKRGGYHVLHLDKNAVCAIKKYQHYCIKEDIQFAVLSPRSRKFFYGTYCKAASVPYPPLL